jgi:hypothetical protein
MFEMKRLIVSSLCSYLAIVCFPQFRGSFGFLIKQMAMLAQIGVVRYDQG